MLELSPSREVRGSAGIAFLAVEHLAEHPVPTLQRDHPRAIDPRWFMAHMLIMAALKLGHPVPLVVLMKADDGLLHAA